jgi:hypothetical protein
MPCLSVDRYCVVLLLPGRPSGRRSNANGAGIPDSARDNIGTNGADESAARGSDPCNHSRHESAAGSDEIRNDGISDASTCLPETRDGKSASVPTF